MANRNVAASNERKIVACAELYQLCLTREGQVFLFQAEEAYPSINQWRACLLQKIDEYAPFAVARKNATYMAAATALKDLLLVIQQGGRLPACCQE